LRVIFFGSDGYDQACHWMEEHRTATPRSRFGSR
jgi:hypothetical protein